MSEFRLYGKLIVILACFFFVSPIIYGENQISPATNSANNNKKWTENVGEWYEENMSYATITILMTVESSFVPFPSEIIIPPAAYVASQPGSKLNVFLIVVFATLGALIGALINYLLALWLGRPVLYRLADSKIGSFLLLSSEKIKRAEDYFNNHGKVSTFVGRLIPGIRQLISIPAGLSKMNLLSFSLFTVLGAGIWNVVLAALGYLAHGQKDLINKYSHEIGLAIVGVLAVVALIYLLRSFVKKRRNKNLN